MPLSLSNFRTAIAALDEVVTASANAERMAQMTDIERIAIRAGVIQHFEVAYELAWALIARWLNANITPGIAKGVTRRQLYRLAAENGLIYSVNAWMRHHKGRNATSHIYDHDRAEAVYRGTVDFVHDARPLLEALEARND